MWVACFTRLQNFVEAKVLPNAFNCSKHACMDGTHSIVGSPGLHTMEWHIVDPFHSNFIVQDRVYIISLIFLRFTICKKRRVLINCMHLQHWGQSSFQRCTVIFCQRHIETWHPAAFDSHVGHKSVRLANLWPWVSIHPHAGWLEWTSSG